MTFGDFWLISNTYIVDYKCKNLFEYYHIEKMETDTLFFKYRICGKSKCGEINMNIITKKSKNEYVKDTKICLLYNNPHRENNMIDIEFEVDFLRTIILDSNIIDSRIHQIYNFCMEFVNDNIEINYIYYDNSFLKIICSDKEYVYNLVY
jgi:hypothetical protein